MLIIAGIVTFIILNRRGKLRQGMLVGTGLIVVGIGVWILAAAVQTDREAITTQTRDLIGATARAQTTDLDRLLAPDARLFVSIRIPGVTISSAGLDKADILKKVKQELGQAHTVSECAILETQAVIDAPGSGRSQVRVRAVIDSFPTFSWWKVTWGRGNDGPWRATAIQPLDVGFPGTGD
jgi:hypothetical protein